MPMCRVIHLFNLGCERGSHRESSCLQAVRPRQPLPSAFFERYLTAWVALCILVGIGLGQGLPSLFKAIGAMEVARVNLPVGLLIWVMIIPMLLKIDFGALHQVRGHLKGIGVTLFINWLVKPFSMAFLGWLFIRVLFADWLPADQLDSYVAGLILLAAAPAPPWCLSGVASPTAIPTSPCRRWR